MMMKILAFSMLLLLMSDAMGAAKTWTGVVSTSWSLSTNWSPSGVPQNGDDVTIPSVAVRQPTYAGGTVFLNLISCTGTLTITGGTLTVASASSIANLNLNGGILGGTGNVQITGNFNWTDGILSGTGTFSVNGGATAAVSGAGTKTLSSKTFSNSGTTNWSGTGNIDGSGSSLFIIQSTGALNIQSAADFTGSTRVENRRITISGNTFRGQMTKSASSGLTAISGEFINNGDLIINLGASLQLLAGGSGTGDFDINGGSLSFLGGTYNCDAGSAVHGGGQVQVSGGTVNVSGVFNMTRPLATGIATACTGGTLNLLSASTLSSLGAHTFVSSGALNLSSGETAFVERLQISGGTLTGSDLIRVSALMEWSGGTMSGTGRTEIRTTADLNISGASQKTMSGSRVLENYGDVFFAGTGVLVGSGSPIIHNMPNADFHIQTDSNISGSGTFNNHGNGFEGPFGEVFKESGPPNHFAIEWVFNNDGRVECQQGPGLSLSGGGLSSGRFDIQNVSALRFEGGTHTLTDQSSIFGPGALIMSGGVANISGFVTLTRPMPNISLNVASGTINFLAASTIQQIGGYVKIQGGTANFSAGQIVTMEQLDIESGTLTGSDTVKVTDLVNWSGGTMRGSGITQVDAGGHLAISGSSVKRLDDTRLLETLFLLGDTTIWTGTGNIESGPNARFDSRGDWRIETDADWLGGTVRNITQMRKMPGFGETLFTANVTNQNLLVVDVGTHLRFGGAFIQSLSIANTRLHEDAVLTGPPLLTYSAGALRTDILRESPVVGILDMVGSSLVLGADPNAPGRLLLDGGLRFGANARLVVTILGTNNSNPDSIEFSQIIATSNAAPGIDLAGQLKIVRNSAYLPTVCDTIPIIMMEDSSEQIEGDFDSIVLEGFGGMFLEPVLVYEPQQVNLVMRPLRPGDANANGCVDDVDLAIVLGSFGSVCGCCPADIDRDGLVDDTDLAIVLENFGLGC